MKPRILLPLAFLLLFAFGCTITVVHKFDERYYQALRDTNSSAVVPVTVVDNNDPEVIDDREKGEITIINDPKFNETVNIFRLGETEPVGGVIGGDSVVVQGVAVGDILEFKVVGVSYLMASPHKVEKLGTTFKIALGIRWNDARNKYSRIKNADASRHSFDLYQIDPIYINAIKEEGGGRKGQVFKSLGETDVDWTAYDDDIVLKDGFALNVVNRGEGSTETKMVYGGESFKKSFSANIGVSASAPGAGGSLNVGFNNMTKDASANGSVFTYSRKADTVYIIDLVPEKQQLTEEFIRFVKEELPVPVVMPRSLEEAKKDRVYSGYKNTFIKKWGTHYPMRVHYGGYIIAYQQNTLEELSNEDSWGVSVKAEVKAPVEGATVGVSGQFGYGEDRSFVSKSSNDKLRYTHVGGKGDINNWSVNDDVQPIKIQLSRLEDLLVPMYFENELPEDVLSKKKTMLKFALQDYLNSVEDVGVPQPPIGYEIYTDGLTNIENGFTLKKSYDDNYPEEIFGFVDMGYSNRDRSEYDEESLWERSEENGKRVQMRKGQTEPFPKSKLRCIIDPLKGQSQEDYSFFLRATLSSTAPALQSWHCIGSGLFALGFEDVKEKPYQVMKMKFRKGGDYQCTESEFPDYTRDGDWEVDISVKVRRVEAVEMGFD